MNTRYPPFKLSLTRSQESNYKHCLIKDDIVDSYRKSFYEKEGFV